jgi:lysine 6-dehydrogenase
MRLLVLGAGLQGSACAYDLLQNPDVERITLADRTLERLPSFLAPHRRDRRLTLAPLDARDTGSVGRLMEQADACLNALPYYFNLEIARLAVGAGIHYCDLGGNTQIVFQQMELDEAARDRNVSVIPDCGLAPGMVNILADAGIRALDQADSVKILVGGLPQHPTPPLNYQIVYSLEGVLDYYTTPSWVVRDGEPVQVEALSEIEPVDFPEPAGELEAFHTAGGLSTMPWTFKGRVRTMEYKTLRYPGHAHIMEAIRDLGLLDLTPVEVKGVTVVPRDLFVKVVAPRLTKPTGRDLVALRVIVEGTKDGKSKRVGWELLDYYDEARGISAMMRTTGYSLSITGQMQARGEIKPAGVWTPDEAVPAGRYIQELERRGVHIRELGPSGRAA